MVVEGDPEAQGTHLLLVLVKNDKVTIDSVVLCDQVQQWNPHVAKGQEIATFHGVYIVDVVDTGTIVKATGVVPLDVVSDLEDCPLRLKVVEDLRVHLDLNRVCLLENRIQTIVEHAA